MANEWIDIEKGWPPCDSEKVFVGINSAGYVGCFNEFGRMSSQTGYRTICLYATAEGCDEVMTDLAKWKWLEMPGGVTNG